MKVPSSRNPPLAATAGWLAGGEAGPAAKAAFTNRQNTRKQWFGLSKSDPLLGFRSGDYTSRRGLQK